MNWVDDQDPRLTERESPHTVKFVRADYSDEDLTGFLEHPRARWRKLLSSRLRPRRRHGHHYQAGEHVVRLVRNGTIRPTKQDAKTEIQYYGSSISQQDGQKSGVHVVISLSQCSAVVAFSSVHCPL